MLCFNICYLYLMKMLTFLTEEINTAVHVRYFFGDQI